MVRDTIESTVASSHGRTAPPWPLPPMLAKLGAMPRDAAAHAYEFKWDGYRTVLVVEQGRARVQSRSLRDVTREYPELQGIAQALGQRQALLDGEIVVLGEEGLPSFQALQNRAGFAGPREPAVVSYLAFDVLWLDGRSLVDLPYAERRKALEGLDLGEGAWVPPAQRDGETVLHASRELGLEGVVAKRLDSPYEPGKRSGAWVKVKNILRQEFVIGGWTPGEGSRKGLGALLLGYHEGRALRYAGKVGTGFTDATLKTLAQLLAPLRRDACPFEGGELPEHAVFVEPRLVCEVAFAQWTHEGILRQASFKGLRSDKDAKDVVREEVP